MRSILGHAFVEEVARKGKALFEDGHEVDPGEREAPVKEEVDRWNELGADRDSRALPSEGRGQSALTSRRFSRRSVASCCFASRMCRGWNTSSI